jgi:hypothetical protein
MTFMNGLPRVAVHDIAIQERDNELVAGTHGRSLYIAKLEPLQKIYDSLQLIKAWNLNIRL